MKNNAGQKKVAAVTLFEKVFILLPIPAFTTLRLVDPHLRHLVLNKLNITRV
jgi:hypothetical protein